MIRRKLRIFSMFLWKDLWVHFQSFFSMYFDHALLKPVVFITASALLLPVLHFKENVIYIVNMAAAGLALELFINTSFNMLFPFLIDLESSNFTSYQLQLLDAPWLLAQKVAYSTLLSIFYMLPYFPLAALILQGRLDLSAMSIPLFSLMFVLVALTCSMHHLFMCCVLKSMYDVKNFWMRLTFPAVQLAGSVVPWSAMNNFSRYLGLFTLANPFLYIIEGFRGALFGPGEFISIVIVVPVLLVFNVLLFWLSCYLFKRKLDHI
jgi:ABC-type multidrug transport system permease subunit